MNTPKKILFIQHASGLGGSCMSLFYTIQNLDRSRFEPILALANDSQVVIDFYKSAGYSPIACPRITFWGHTTGSNFSLYRLSGWLNIYQTLKSWNKGMRSTIDLVKAINPSIVHLNSVVLSISALALKKNNIPFVWHVREHPPKTIFGFRTHLISKMLMKLPSELIFISNADRQAWIKGQRGQVIHNFVNFSEFDRNRNGSEIRKANNIAINAPMILYLGGLRTIKGIFTLINALHILKKRLPDFYCLMPGSTYNPPASWQNKMARHILPILGSGTVGQRAMRLIKNLDLQKNCVLTDFNSNIVPLIATADVVVFPSTVPHFARPVIEAGSMAKPVVASNLAGVKELVQNNLTGILVEPNDPRALADALMKVLSDKHLAETMGEAGYLQAKEKFSAEKNCEKIMGIYDRIL